jgi:hypothetical protein
MKRVLRYPLPNHGINRIGMPGGAKVLALANQDGVLCLWALSDDSHGEKLREFCVIYTAHDFVPEHATYVGTVLTDSGTLVRHVFETR